MGVRLPDDVPPWVAEIVVGHIPECDVAGLRRCGDQWAARAAALSGLADELEALAGVGVPGAVAGVTAEMVAEQAQAVAADMRSISEGYATLSRSTHETATALELQQYLALGVAIAITVQVTASLALFATGGSVMLAAQRIAARKTVALGWRSMLERLAQQLARTIVQFPRSAAIAGAAALGMGTGGVVNWAAQRKQISDGHRDRVDWREVQVAVIAGGAGGALGAPVGRVTATAIIKRLSAQASRRARIGGQVAATVAAGATGGLAGAAAGTVAAALTSGKDLRGQDLLAALVSGLGSGVVTAFGSSLHAVRAAGAATTVPGGDGSTPRRADLAVDQMSEGLTAQRRAEGEQLAENLAGRTDLDPQNYQGPAREFAEYLRNRYGAPGGSPSDSSTASPASGSHPRTHAGTGTREPTTATSAYAGHSGAGPASESPPGAVGTVSVSETGSPNGPASAGASDPASAAVATAPDIGTTAAAADAAPTASADMPSARNPTDLLGPPDRFPGYPASADSSSVPHATDSTSPGAAEPDGGRDIPSATGAGGTPHRSGDWFRPGQMDCAPEAVADTARVTGIQVDLAELPSDAAGRGVMMGDYLRTLGADAKPGGWPTLRALFDDVAVNGGHVAAAAEFGYGAHAFTVTHTQPGHFVIHEKTPIIGRSPGDKAHAVLRDVHSDGLVVQQEVDAAGRRIGESSSYYDPDAVDNWISKFGRVDIVAGAEFHRVPGTGDRWAASLPLDGRQPGGPDGLRYGLDIPSRPLGSDAAVLDRPTRFGPEVPSRFAVETRFADLTRGLEMTGPATAPPRFTGLAAADGAIVPVVPETTATGGTRSTPVSTSSNIEVAPRMVPAAAPDSGTASMPVTEASGAAAGTGAAATPAAAAEAVGVAGVAAADGPSHTGLLSPWATGGAGQADPVRGVPGTTAATETVAAHSAAPPRVQDPGPGMTHSPAARSWPADRPDTEPVGDGSRPDQLPAEPDETPSRIPGPLIPMPQPTLVPDPTRHDTVYPADHPAEFEQPTAPAFPNPSFPGSDEDDTTEHEPVLPREVTESRPNLPADRPRFQPYEPGTEAEPGDRDPAAEPLATPWTAPPQHFPAATPTHLPATSPAGTVEVPGSSKYSSVRPDESTPGAPVDPKRRPGLDPHSLDYNPPLSDVPKHATGPTTAPAPPPGEPVTPARPVPWMQASPTGTGRSRGKRKPSRPAPDPAPYPITSPRSEHHAAPADQSHNNATPEPEPTPAPREPGDHRPSAGGPPGPDTFFYDALDLPVRSRSPWDRHTGMRGRPIRQTHTWHADAPPLPPTAGSGRDMRRDPDHSAAAVPDESVSLPVGLEPPSEANTSNTAAIVRPTRPDGGVVPELGPEVDALAGQSRALTELIDELRATGWTFGYGPAEEGSYADRDHHHITIAARHHDITIDPHRHTITLDLDRPGSAHPAHIIRALAVEAAIAASDNRVLENGPRDRPTDTWFKQVVVQRMRAEARAQLFMFGVQHEIELARRTTDHPPLPAPTDNFYAINKGIADLYQAGVIDTGEALNRLATTDHDRIRRLLTTHTFGQYWKTRYTRRHGVAPGAVEFTQLNHIMLTEQMEFADAEVFNYGANYGENTDILHFLSRPKIINGPFFLNRRGEAAVWYADDPDLTPDGQANRDARQYPKAEDPTISAGTPVPGTEEAGPEVSRADRTDKPAISENDPVVEPEIETGPAVLAEASVTELLRSNKVFVGVFVPDNITRIGDAAVAAGLSMVTIKLTHDPALVGVVLFANSAPAQLVEIFAGYASDFHDPREIMRKSQRIGLGAALTGLGVVGLSALGVAAVPPAGTAAALAATLAVEAAATTYYLAATARVGERDAVALHERRAAQRLGMMARYLSGLVGRPVGAVLATVSPAALFALNVVTYIPNQISLRRHSSELTFQRPDRAPDLRGKLGDTRDGVRHLWRDSTLRRIVLVETATNAAIWVLNVRTTLAVEATGASDLAVGGTVAAILAAGTAGGVLAGALPAKSSVTATWRQPWTGLRVLARNVTYTPVEDLHPRGVAVWALCATGMAVSTDPVVLAAGTFGISLVGVGMNLSVMNRFHDVVPDDAHGRASSAKKLINGAGVTVGSLLGGTLVATVDIGGAGWLAAGTFGALATGTLLHRFVQRFKGGGEPEANGGAGIREGELSGPARTALPASSGSAPGPEDAAASQTPDIDPVVIKNCAIQIGRIFRALGADTTPEPDDTDPRWAAEDNWQPLEEILGAQLRPVPREPGRDPVRDAAETVRARKNGIDTVVLAVDGHVWMFTHMKGKRGEDRVLVFDTLSADPESRVPGIRDYDGDENGENKWEPTYRPEDIDTLFTASFTADHGVLTPRPRPARALAHTRHPRNLQGPPPRDASENQPEDSGAGGRRDNSDTSATPAESTGAPEPEVSEPGPSTEKIVSTRELFGTNKPYRSIYVSNVLTEVGNSVQLSAVPLLTVQLTGSYEAAGLITAGTFLPKILFEIPAGYLAEFTDRLKLMLISQGVGALGVLVAASSVAFHLQDVGTILAVTAFVDGAATVIYLRALGGTVRDLVTPEQRPRANRMSSIQGYVGGIGGRALGPVLLGLDKMAPFVLNGVSFAWNLASIYRMRDHLPVYPRQQHRVREIGRELGAGVRAVWQDPFLRRHTGTITLTNMAVAALNLRAVAVVEEAALPGWVAGPVLAAGAAGAVAGAFVLPTKLIEKTDINTLFAGALGVFAATAGLQAVTTNPFLVAVGTAGFGMAAVSMNSQLTGYQQEIASGGLFNRVASVDKAVTGVGSAAGAWIAGGLLTNHGIEISGWLPAAVVGAAAGGTALHYAINRWRTLRRSTPTWPDFPPVPAPTISRTLIGAAAGASPFGTVPTAAAEIRTFRVFGNALTVAFRSERIGSILARFGYAASSTVTAPAGHSASGIVETTVDGISHWKYPGRSLSWPSRTGPIPPSVVVTELGAGVDALVAESPTLSVHIAELRAAGWTFHYGATGEGSYADRDLRCIVIDGHHRNADRVAQATWALATEVAIAASDARALRTGPHNETTEQWVEKLVIERMRAEAEAQLFLFEVQQEIQHTRQRAGRPAPSMTTEDRSYPMNKAVYNRLASGALDRDEALNQLASMPYHAYRRQQSTQEFDRYWKTRYTRRQPETTPSETELDQISNELLIDHTELSGAVDTNYNMVASGDAIALFARPKIIRNPLFPLIPSNRI
ncbi:MFS transporter [Nocardia sp. NPDC050193]